MAKRFILIFDNLKSTAGGNIAQAGINDNGFSLSNDFMLPKNCPNPFNSGTTIRFMLVESTEAKLTIYDLPGREIQTLIDDFWQAGVHTLFFDAAGLSSGAYFYRLRAEDAVVTKRMILVK